MTKQEIIELFATVNWIFAKEVIEGSRHIYTFRKDGEEMYVTVLDNIIINNRKHEVK